MYLQVGLNVIFRIRNNKNRNMRPYVNENGKCIHEKCFDTLFQLDVTCILLPMDTMCIKLC